MVRFRQITAAIQKRRYATKRAEDVRVSWQTRILASFIAGGYQMGKDEPNKALESAREIAFDEVEKAMLGAEEAKPKENARGSYERLMSGFAQLEARGKTL